MEYQIKNPKISLSLCLDTRSNCKKVDNTFPLKYRISFQGNKKLYATGYTLTEKDFETLTSPSKRKTDKLTETKDALDFIRSEFIEVLNKDFITKFSHQEFTDKLKEFNDEKNGISKKEDNVYEYLERYIEQLLKNEQINTADTYKSTLSNLKTFTNRKRLQFKDIDVEFLKRFENQKVNIEKKSISTVAIYCRNIKRIFNVAIDENVIDRSIYPFGDKKYLIPESLNLKKALNISDIIKILKYESEFVQEMYARDIFVFSYICNGINLADIANLKYSNIDNYNNRITFIRKKTSKSKRTQNSVKEIIIPYYGDVKDLIDQIIEKWKKDSSLKDDFIFGIIEKNQSAVEQNKKIKQATKQFNKYLKRIAEKLEIPFDITTYFARHTWATMTYRNSKDILAIKEGMGHSSRTTSERYISTLPIEELSNSQSALFGGKSIKEIKTKQISTL